MAKIDKSKTDFFLFGGEESFGYLPVSFVRDKDSLSSALLLLEILTEKKIFSIIWTRFILNTVFFKKVSNHLL
ncbi:phosphoglucomutase/phosphomannomutase, alpha/beta/alpha domain III protein [Leptospira interrogans serovar Grippotyphosa str. LT2186]|nr:phosphoglucomutase/phosphomannomutase, alpha/beta/alpha domain III protein [Leptospira interrogans serovar Grippotyphosa str. LT2186]EMN73536.1 phosphoglucomutase/phosphomannomutase, alpha/beta/alpha domain III protein [Leptospira interrogans serovar Bataviae str. UI 08561]EMP06970.1 phosphoglucomutase/phosphomannomutase, alpha/beta/alpha domain III protein [Leptospira interrogans serovar Pyrogenes str. 200701872]